MALKIPPHYVERLLPHEKTQIHSIISGFSFLEDMLCQLGNQSADMFVVTVQIVAGIGSYLEWTLKELKVCLRFLSPKFRLASYVFSEQQRTGVSGCLGRTSI